MAELDRLSRRIDTARDLQSVVRTMKTLSAVSISQAEQAAAAITAHLETVERGLQVALRHAPRLLDGAARAEGPTALVVVGSEFGLCGTFNERLIGEARGIVAAEAGAGRGPFVLLAGRRLAQRWDPDLPDPGAALDLPSSAGLLGAAAGAVLRRLDGWQRETGGTRIVLLHQAEGEAGHAAPRTTRLAPVTADELAAIAARPWPTRCLPMAAGEPGALFRRLLRQRILARVYAALALSRSAEYAARLEAMRAADRNIGEKLQALEAEFRLRRQEAITAELLDVVSGFEAAAERD